MESREYRGGSSDSSGVSNDPFWFLATAILILCLVLVGLPAIVIGFIGQRYTYRSLARFGWRLSAGIWLALAAASMLLLYSLFQHGGLVPMMQREVGDYLQNARHYQFDVFRWPGARLWSETWPLWLRTLAAFPLWGFWFEISTRARRGHAGQLLMQRERERERRVERSKLRARKRVLRPERLPDEVVGMMVMGVPIDGDEEQE